MENEKEGFPITALREIRILQLLRHENIVNLVRRRLCKAFTRFMFQYLNKQITFPFIRHLLTRKIRETFFSFILLFQIEICRTKATQHNKHKSLFYLVFDFCEHDLAGLLSNFSVKFSIGEIKKVAYFIFTFRT